MGHFLPQHFADANESIFTPRSKIPHAPPARFTPSANRALGLAFPAQRFQVDRFTLGVPCVMYLRDVTL
jgi:hypothetical protein